MGPKPKTKFRQPSSRGTVSSPAAKKARDATSMSSLMVPLAPTSGINSRIQQAKNSAVVQLQEAKNSAVAQAQQDGCTGNFRIFDSLFGNFLVPVIPTRAELAE